MGMAIDPNYTANKKIYICYAYMDDNTMFARASEWIDA